MTNIESNTIFQGNALSLFERLDQETFNLIYIDPPWDEKIIRRITSIEAELKDYQELIFRVAQQAYRCLNPQGHLLFYAPVATLTNYQSIIEKVFDREKLRYEFIIPGIKGTSNSVIGRNHTSLFLFSKSLDSPIYSVKNERALVDLERIYSKSDENGSYRLISLFSPSFMGERQRLNYTWKGISPPENRQWKYPVERVEELHKEGLIEISEGGSKVGQKRYLTYDSLPQIGTVWDDIDIVDRKLRKKYPGSQSPDFFKRIITLLSKEDDWILDPFAGSGGMLLCANQLNRNWVGNDMSEVAAEIIQNRLNEEQVPFQRDILPFEKVWNEYKGLHRSEEQLLKELINHGETKNLEFKEFYQWNSREAKKDKKMPDKIVKELAAFMNSVDGGTLLVGVSDDKRILDLSKDFQITDPNKQDQDGFALAITNKIKDKLTGRAIRLIGIDFPVIDFMIICRIRVKPSPIPIFFEEKFVVRNGTSAVELTTQKALEYLENKEP